MASCILSSSNLLSEVALVVGRGSQGVVDKYAGAFGKTDGTASFFKYLRHRSLIQSVSFLKNSCLGCILQNHFL